MLVRICMLNTAVRPNLQILSFLEHQTANPTTRTQKETNMVVSQISCDFFYFSPDDRIPKNAFHILSKHLHPSLCSITWDVSSPRIVESTRSIWSGVSPYRHPTKNTSHLCHLMFFCWRTCVDISEIPPRFDHQHFKAYNIYNRHIIFLEQIIAS